MSILLPRPRTGMKLGVSVRMVAPAREKNTYTIMLKKIPIFYYVIQARPYMVNSWLCCCVQSPFPFVFIDLSSFSFFFTDAKVLSVFRDLPHSDIQQYLVTVRRVIWLIGEFSLHTIDHGLIFQVRIKKKVIFCEYSSPGVGSGSFNIGMATTPYSMDIRSDPPIWRQCITQNFLQWQWVWNDMKKTCSGMERV